MDSSLNNFGPRFRRLVEERGTIESAYEAIGVSRATLFNWFNRDTPPPGNAMIEKIRRYLGPRADDILDDNLDADSVREEQMPYGTAAMLRREIQAHHEELITHAGDDVARLGWILIQTKTHLATPADWKAPLQKPTSMQRQSQSQSL